jgi:hypothetical protein
MKTLPALFALCTVLGASAVHAQTVIGGCKIEPNAQCAKAKLLRADLRGAKLAGANLAAADMDSADLSNADLSNADLQGASLLGAKLNGAKLTGAKLSGATWTDRLDGYGTPIPKTCAQGSVGECK